MTAQEEFAIVYVERACIMDALEGIMQQVNPEARCVEISPYDYGFSLKEGYKIDCPYFSLMYISGDRPNKPQVTQRLKEILDPKIWDCNAL